MDDRFERVRIGRRRVHGGLAATAMGLLAASLALDLIYVVGGHSGWYDAAWWVMAIGAVALAASIVPGIMAWIEERRASTLYMSRDDDGRAVVLTAALMTSVVNLALRFWHGAVIGGELGTAIALSIGTLALMGFARPLGDWLADRLPSGRASGRVSTGETTARERETTRF